MTHCFILAEKLCLDTVIRSMFSLSKISLLAEMSSGMIRTLDSSP